MARTLAVGLVAASALAGSDAYSAREQPTFLFGSRAALPGDLVTVRTDTAPLRVSVGGKVEPPLGPLRLYLVPSGSTEVRSRYDPRLHFVGSLVWDRRGRGSVSFTMPPIEIGDYVLAAWCSGCQPKRGEPRFVVQRAKRGDPRTLVRVREPTGVGCPVTIPNDRRPFGEKVLFNHGNAALWATLPAAGVLAVPADRVGVDGTIREKMIWRGGVDVFEGLDVQIFRFGAAEPKWRPEIVNGAGASWAARLHFPGEGCWKIEGRSGDIRLSFVMETVIRS